MSPPADGLAQAVAVTEAVVSQQLSASGDPVAIGLAHFAAGVALILPRWGAERTLAALDEVIEAAAASR